MVRVVNEKRETFLRFAAGRKIICFGMGKRLEHFRRNYPQLLIAGIINNYKERDTLTVEGREIPVWLPEEAGSRIDKDSVVIIASIAVEEIVEQMDRIASFSEMSCYIEAPLDGYIGIDADQKAWLQKVIMKLQTRTPESILKENYGVINQTADKKKYQIWQYYIPSNTAANKAREDIKRIAGEMGYQAVNMHCSRGEAGTNTAIYSDRLVTAEWDSFLSDIPQFSSVLMQLPIGIRFPKEQILTVKKKKRLSFLTVIHDIDGLRQKNSTVAQWQEFQTILDISDFLIVHHDRMVQYFEQNGVERRRLIPLQIFDYLYDGIRPEKTFERSITFAGNLDMRKSKFLTRLGDLSPLKIHLYGPNFSEEILSKAGNVAYGGSILPENLPQKLNKGFGLIWDGSRADTCAGGMGEYLRYNSPHKLSLYLASGLPVVIWSGAAQAKFVKENGVGITVDSLYDVRDALEKINEEDYEVLVQNAGKIAERLTDGYYTRTALFTAENAQSYL